MNPADAIAAVRAYINSAGIDYPTNDLVADRFEAGWSVYAPVHVDTSDPMAFLDMPVGRAIFLVADSGRIEQTSSSTPPQFAQQRFAEQERALAQQVRSAAGSDDLADLADAFNQASANQPAAIGFTVVEDAPKPEPATAHRDQQLADQAAAMLDPVAQQLAALGPPEWSELSAVFALTVRAGSADCAFATRGGWQPVTVPRSVMELVRAQREVSAQMSAGPWWRLLLTVTREGRLRADYDYADQPFPDGQLQPAQNYRDDIAAYPRQRLPVWLAGYLAGPAAQGRPSTQALATASSDETVGRRPVETEDIEPLPDTWARWAVLAAVYAGARSQWGPRIYPDMAWYESDARSGSTLHLLPGDRAVLSGGRWNSDLLSAAYQRHDALPDLYCGAPAWVDDAVLNTRNQNGLLSFCYWWDQGRWWRGATDTFDELDEPLPVIWTPEETVDAMTAVVGSGTQDACRQLLAAADSHRVTPDDVVAVFARFGNPDPAAAFEQLNLAGLTR